jgi:hypothetical protein
MTQNQDRYVRVGITLRQSQLDWIRKHKEINFSGMVQNLVEDLMEQEQENEGRKRK